MEGLHIHIWVGHGDPLEGWSLHTLGWMHALSLMGGITGTNLKTKEVLAFMSSGICLHSTDSSLHSQNDYFNEFCGDLRIKNIGPFHKFHK